PGRRRVGWYYPGQRARRGCPEPAGTVRRLFAGVHFYLPDSAIHGNGAAPPALRAATSSLLGRRSCLAQAWGKRSPRGPTDLVGVTSPMRALKVAWVAMAILFLVVGPAWAYTTKKYDDKGKVIEEVGGPDSPSFSGAAVGAGIGAGVTIIGAGYGFGRIGS